MSLTKRLLLGSLLVVSVLVGFVVIAIDRTLRQRITEEAARELGREARLVAAGWDAGADADSVADRAGDALGHRVTLIGREGAVLGDSRFDGRGLRALENHAARPEVVAARTSGYGLARRVSTSAGDEEVYVAVRAPLGVARVSFPTESLDEIFSAARRDIAGAGLIALLGSVLLAAVFSRAVSRPIVELRDVAQALAAGDLSRRPQLVAPGEVGDLAIALHRLAEQLAARLGALEEEETLLTALFDALNEGAVVVDASGSVVRINETARWLLRTTDEVPFSAQRLPDDPVLQDALAAALAGRATDGAEVMVHDRTLRLIARPLAGGGGAVLAALDLTPVRRLEIVRRDFVANVSHELRTPLTIVGGFAETLRDDALSPEQHRHFAETIHANTVRMQRIVDDLLDLSRIESGGWVPNPAFVDVRAVAVEAGAVAQQVAVAKGVAFDFEIDADARTVFADATALRQVITNLSENAVRHTSLGTITVFSEADAGIGTWVGVRDTGTGIAAEHLPRIFERFYRADPGRSREQGGTGLGLAIVKHLAEGHGGRVRAESAIGSGTTIAVFFPTTPPGMVLDSRSS